MSGAELAKARSISALLNRLALHCPVRNLPEGQDALLMEDTITDLLPYDTRRIAEACDAWRRGPVPYFPTSGQLIALMPKPTFSRHYDVPKGIFLPAPERTGPIRSWRQILAEKGKTFTVPSEAEAPPAKPAQQETVLPDGSLTEPRRAELAELRARVSRVPPDVSREI